MTPKEVSDRKQQVVAKNEVATRGLTPRDVVGRVFIKKNRDCN